jgi:membrane-associated protease RseP (regulator of RpoE activity)
MTCTPKLLSAVFVLGCGSSAMASPNRGQWTNSSPGYGNPGSPTQVAPPGEDQSIPAQGSPSDGQGGSQGQDPSQAQSPTPDQEQDQDNDTSETHAWQAGQSHLGVMVMAMTPELRRFFGVTSDRGVLVARIEPNSAAARAGLQVGDVLTRVGTRGVRNGDDVLQALAAHPGGRIRIAAVREHRLFATIPGAPANQDQDRQGRQDRL